MQKLRLSHLIFSALLSAGCTIIHCPPPASELHPDETSMTEVPAAIAFYKFHPRLIQAGATFSVDVMVFHAKYEEPVWSSFQETWDEKSNSFFLAGRIRRFGGAPQGEETVSMHRLIFKAPEFEALSQLRILPQEGSRMTWEKLVELGGPYSYELEQRLFVQSKTVQALLQTPSLPFRTVYQDDRYDRMPVKQQVLNSAEELSEFFTKQATDSTDSNFPSSPPVDAIDFATEQVIAVSFGAQPLGIGGSIAILEEQTERILVHPVRWLPAIGGFPDNPTIGWPCHLVAIKRTNKPIAFAQTLDGYR